MAEDRPRYYTGPKRKGGKAVFWAPGKFGEQYGFHKSIPLGEDGPAAKALAIEWNAKLDKVRAEKKAGVEPPQQHPNGSLGSFYSLFKTTEAWSLMEPRTRELYERAWPAIEERFGATLVTKITPDASERFHVELHPQHDNSKRDPDGKLKLTWHKAHLVLKHWRLLLGALVDYRFIPAPAPIGRVSNPSPPSRTAVWLHHEVEQLIAKATEIGEHGMAVGIRLGWDTMMSTVDCRLLPIGGWTCGSFIKDKDGAEEYVAGVIATRRAKSGAMVRVATTPEIDEAVAAYLDMLRAAKLDVSPDAPLLRRGKRLIVFKNRAAFKAAFASVREAAFPGDRRQFGDLRRSGATEAKLGGADDKDLGRTMANRLDQDEGLQSTYVVAASENVHRARKAGREKMAAKFRNPPK